MLEPFRSSVHVQLPPQSSTAGVAHIMEASPLIPTIWRCRPHRSSLLTSAPPEVRRSACCPEHLGTEVPQQQPKTTPRTARSDDGPPSLGDSSVLRLQTGQNPSAPPRQDSLWQGACCCGNKPTTKAPSRLDSVVEPAACTIEIMAAQTC